jgi:hypothetical protein
MLAVKVPQDETLTTSLHSPTVPAAIDHVQIHCHVDPTTSGEVFSDIVDDDATDNTAETENKKSVEETSSDDDLEGQTRKQHRHYDKDDDDDYDSASRKRKLDSEEENDAFFYKRVKDWSGDRRKDNENNRLQAVNVEKSAGIENIPRILETSRMDDDVEQNSDMFGEKCGDNEARTLHAADINSSKMLRLKMARIQ